MKSTPPNQPDPSSTQPTSAQAIGETPSAPSSIEQQNRLRSNTDNNKASPAGKTQVSQQEATSMSTSKQPERESSDKKQSNRSPQEASEQTPDKSASTPPASSANKTAPTPAASKTSTPTASTTTPPKPPAPPPAAPRASGAMATFTLVLACITAVCAVLVTLFLLQRMGQMEQQLQQAMQHSGNTAAEAKELAQRSINMSIESGGKLAYVNTQLEALSDQGSRADTLMQYINNSKIETLPADLRTLLQSAQLQTELTGSVEPLLITLKAIDDRLLRDDILAQSSLRSAIAQDMETIRNMPTPDPMSMSSKVNDLYQKADALRLVISPPVIHANNSDTPRTAPPATQEDTTTSTETTHESGWKGYLSRSWRWTSANAKWLGSSVWTELRSLVRVSPIKNPEAALLSPEQSLVLRENIKLNLLNLRLSIVQKQYAQASTSLQKIHGVITRYYDPHDKAVQDFLSQLAALQTGLQDVSLPQPHATLAALASMSPPR